MAKGVTLIPKRKFDWAPGTDAFIQHVDQFVGAPDVIRVIKANDDRPVLTLEQSGSGSLLNLAEIDQTDPAGRYRLNLAAGDLTIEKATTADWVAIQALLAVSTANKRTNFESPDAAGDDWYTRLDSGGSAGETTRVDVGSSGATIAGLRITCGNGSGSNIDRLSVTTGAATVTGTWNAIQQTGSVLKDLNLVWQSELTISGGVVTVTGIFHHIDTQNNDATDDLDTINGGSSYDLLLIQARHTDRTVVVKHGTGNIQLKAGVDISLDNTDKILLLFYNGSNWVDVGGGNTIDDFLEDTPSNGETSKAPTSNWAYDHENDDDVHDATAVNVSRLSGASYDDVQDYINFFGDRTLLSGGVSSAGLLGSSAGGVSSSILIFVTSIIFW